jgi:pilus assembly protein Flp/PilA
MSKIKNWAISKVAKLQTMQDEEGQGLAEYGLILALIAVACIVALRTLGGDISTILGRVSGGLTSA